MNLDLDKVSKLDPKLKKLLSGDVENMNAFSEPRISLIARYERELDWYQHVSMPLNGLDRIVEILKVSPWEEIVVITINNEELGEHIFVFLSEDCTSYLGTYVQLQQQ